jgi:hypothetical protein
VADLTEEQLEQFIRILRGGREINMQQAAKVRAMTRGRTMEALREARDVVRMAAKEAKQMTKEALKEAAMSARPDRARRRRGEEGVR